VTVWKDEQKGQVVVVRRRGCSCRRGRARRTDEDGLSREELSRRNRSRRDWPKERDGSVRGREEEEESMMKGVAAFDSPTLRNKNNEDHSQKQGRVASVVKDARSLPRHRPSLLSLHRQTSL
jgi:hypothetical protein